MAVPVILSSALIGFLLDAWGYDWVFGAVIIFMILGWILTFRVHEPRNGNDRLI